MNFEGYFQFQYMVIYSRGEVTKDKITFSQKLIVEVTISKQIYSYTIQTENKTFYLLLLIMGNISTQLKKRLNILRLWSLAEYCSKVVFQVVRSYSWVLWPTSCQGFFLKCFGFLWHFKRNMAPWSLLKIPAEFSRPFLFITA